MAGGGLFGRIFQQFFNDVAVKHLARSSLFQRFAMRTHENVTKIKDVASTGANTIGNKVEKSGNTFSDFSKAFADEIKKDLRMK